MFACALLAVIIGARRIQDRTMKRHLTLLGLALFVFVLAVVNDLTLMFSLFDDFISLVGTYVVYRAVMTLSPIGHIKEEIA